MTLNDEGDVQGHRRRGPALEAALLDAAWQVLLEVGYDELTFEAVAAVAGTSRAVLYRRWPAKPELVRAAAVRALGADQHPFPDTGSLRGDLVAALGQLNENRARVGLELEARLLGRYREAGTDLSEMRDNVTGGRRPRMDAVLDRAVARGEVDERRLTPRARRLPLDLFRNEVLTTRRSVSQQVIESMVDEVLVPYLTRRI